MKKYDIPPTLETLFEIDKQLKEQNDHGLYYYLGAGLLFNRKHGYEVIPQDSVTFASTGVGGDHFAFLTKNDTISDLEEAPIIFVQPMDFINPVKLVARHLRDFLSLFVRLKELYVFERLQFYQNKDEFESDYRETYLPSVLKNEENLNLFISTLMNNVSSLKQIDDPYHYVKQLNSES